MTMTCQVGVEPITGRFPYSIAGSTLGLKTDFWCIRNSRCDFGKIIESLYSIS